MNAIRWLATFLALAPIALAAEKHPVPETVAPGARLVQVYSGPQSFDGPTWDPKGNRLYFTAIGEKGARILRLDAPGKATTWLDHASGLHGTCLSTDGRLLVALSRSHRIVSFALGTDVAGEPTVVYEGPTLNQPRDLRQAPGGDLYFTDPDPARRKPGAVYVLRPEGQLVRALADVNLPNGIAIAPDGRTLYVSDGDRGLWRAYGIAANGVLGPGKFFLNPRTGLRGEPEGMTVDEVGNLYATGRGGVWVVTPEAKELGLIAVPEPCTNVTFGGEDGRSLYLTCRKKVYRMAMQVRGARPMAEP